MVGRSNPSFWGVDVRKGALPKTKEAKVELRVKFGDRSIENLKCRLHALARKHAREQDRGTQVISDVILFVTILRGDYVQLHSSRVSEASRPIGSCLHVLGTSSLWTFVYGSNGTWKTS